MVTGEARANSLDELTELEASISPQALGEYLASCAWTRLRSAEGIAELWAPPESTTTARQIDVFLPLDQTFSDFGRRFKQALADTARMQEVDFPELADAISRVRTDVFFVRLDQTTADNTIPLGQAKDLVESLQRMVRAAATSETSPGHSHRGRRPQRVTEFLTDDLRFGHTRRGSFIVTVAARLRDDEEREESVSEGPIQVQATRYRPYGRRVMEKLARGLAATQQYAAGEDTVPDLETVQQVGVSPELVSSLIDVASAEGLRGVDLSFQWAGQEPSPDDIPETIRVSALDLPKLESVRDRLVRERPPETETLTGRIAGLERVALGGGEEGHTVVLEAEVDGRLRKVRVPLSATDYEWAIRAHQARLLFTVSGTLVKKRSWELQGNVEVDLRQLRGFLEAKTPDVT